MNTTYEGTNKMIMGIVLGVITFWLFAQSMVNVVPAIQESLHISLNMLNIAISLTALFSGMFVVAAGNLADRIGRKKMTYIGLLLNIIGSFFIIIADGAFLLIFGRIIQGFSAACIMPATIALVSTYFVGPKRQRALSYWSIGSWGGSGVCSFFGGAVATYLGWQWIFIFSIICSILAMILLKDTPESKGTGNKTARFDVLGLGLFVIMMLGLNLLITKGADFGWTSMITFLLLFVTVGTTLLFIKIEWKKRNALIDFRLFQNKAYTAATISNFLLNAVAGTLVITNLYIQMGRGYNAFQSGLLSVGYLVSVLVMIRVGEKLLQKLGARLPMLIGSALTAFGIGLMAFTFLSDTYYMIAVFIGFILFGTGLGMYATPSTDTAVCNAPDEKLGTASGIYKMASSLGSSFGVAISTAIYSMTLESGHLNTAATAGIITNLLFAICSFITIWICIPAVVRIKAKKQNTATSMS